jgi:hypothetical protein
VNQPIRSRVLNYDAAPFVPGSVADSPSSAEADPVQRVGFNSPANRYYELSAHSDEDDAEEDSSCNTPTRQTEKEVGIGPGSLPSRQVKAVDLTKGSDDSDDDRSEESFDFYKSIDLNKPPYHDLTPFAAKIKWRTDPEGVQWPRYDKPDIEKSAVNFGS